MYYILLMKEMENWSQMITFLCVDDNGQLISFGWSTVVTIGGRKYKTVQGIGKVSC